MIIFVYIATKTNLSQGQFSVGGTGFQSTRDKSDSIRFYYTKRKVPTGATMSPQTAVRDNNRTTIIHTATHENVVEDLYTVHEKLSRSIHSNLTEGSTQPLPSGGIMISAFRMQHHNSQ
jgi:hypothetical protein